VGWNEVLVQKSWCGCSYPDSQGMILVTCLRAHDGAGDMSGKILVFMGLWKNVLDNEINGGI